MSNAVILAGIPKWMLAKVVEKSQQKLERLSVQALLDANWAADLLPPNCSYAYGLILQAVHCPHGIEGKCIAFGAYDFVRAKETGTLHKNGAEYFRAVFPHNYVTPVLASLRDGKIAVFPAAMRRAAYKLLKGGGKK